MDGNAGRLDGVSMGEIALTAGLGTMQDWALKNGVSRAAVSNAAGCRKAAGASYKSLGAAEWGQRLTGLTLFTHVDCLF